MNTATVIRQNITSTLSSSGTISPKDTYSITSMSEGEVVQADFEEGDRVEAGQILYRIDASLHGIKAQFRQQQPGTRSEQL